MSHDAPPSYDDYMKEAERKTAMKSTSKSVCSNNSNPAFVPRHLKNSSSKTIVYQDKALKGDHKGILPKNVWHKISNEAHLIGNKFTAAMDEQASTFLQGDIGAAREAYDELRAVLAKFNSQNG